MEKMKKSIYTFLGLCLTGLLLIYPQQCLASKPLAIPNPQAERGFFHLNSDIYVTGDLIKYSAYLTNSLGARHNNPSTVLYFEITDSQGNSVAHWRGRARQGFSTGMYQIPDSLKTGIYLFRFYSSWMHNLQPNQIPTTPIVIVNIADQDPLSEHRTETAPLTLHASPQGNSLVAGLRASIDYQILSTISNAGGNQLSITAGQRTIASIAHDSVARFGTISFTPEYANSYSLTFQTGVGQSAAVPLPLVKPEGVAMSISEPSQGIVGLCLNVSESAGKPNYSSVRVLHTGGGTSLLDTIIKFSGGTNCFTIPKRRFAFGVNHIFILSPSLELISSQTFINYDGQPNVSISIPHEKIQRGKPFGITLSAHPAAGSHMNVTVSVHEQSFVSTMNTFGYVGNPDVQPVSGLVRAIPRHNLQRASLAAQSRGDYLREIGVYSLSGRVFNPNNSQPYSNQMVYLSYSDSSANFQFAPTGDNGEFCFLLDSIYDDRSLVIQLAKSGLASDSVQWDIQSKGYPFPSDTINASYYKQAAVHSNYLEELRKRGIIGRIYNPVTLTRTEKQFAPRDDFFYTPNFTLFPAEFYDLDDFTDISDNLLPGIRFRKRRDSYRIGVVDIGNQTINYDDILLILDGHPFTNFDFIAPLNTSDIRRVDVFNAPLMYGDLSFNGVVAIYTHAGVSLSPTIFASPIHVVNNKFHNGNYKPMGGNGSNLPNVSQSVLWEPALRMNANERRFIELPGISIPGVYTISVSGFSDTGEPVESTKSFTVE